MEKKWMLGLALMTVVAMVATATPLAGGSGPLARSPLGERPCHSLLSELECAAFQVALASLPVGEARDRLIADFRLTLEDREAACSCNQAPISEVLYPRVEQIALKL